MHYDMHYNMHYDMHHDIHCNIHYDMHYDMNYDIHYDIQGDCVVGKSDLKDFSLQKHSHSCLTIHKGFVFCQVYCLIIL